MASMVIPKDFRNHLDGTMAYNQGVNDVIARRPLVDEKGFIAQHGQKAWDAYQHGYRVGLKSSGEVTT